MTPSSAASVSPFGRPPASPQDQIVAVVAVIVCMLGVFPAFVYVPQGLMNTAFGLDALSSGGWMVVYGLVLLLQAAMVGIRLVSSILITTAVCVGAFQLFNADRRSLLRMACWASVAHLFLLAVWTVALPFLDFVAPVCFSLELGEPVQMDFLVNARWLIMQIFPMLLMAGFAAVGSVFWAGCATVFR